MKADGIRESSYFEDFAAPALIRATGGWFLRSAVCLGGDLIPHVPEIFIEKMFHPLMKHLNRRTHRANHASTDDSLCKLEVMKAKKMYALIKIQQAFCHIVQAKEFCMSPIKVVHAEAGIAQLGMESFAQAWSDVEK